MPYMLSDATCPAMAVARSLKTLKGHLSAQPHPKCLPESCSARCARSMSPEPVFRGGCRLPTITSNLSKSSEVFGPDHPKVWLEFRTFDDGWSSVHAGDDRRSFLQFPHLPPELRLKIWSQLIMPRIVVACCLYNDETLPQRQKELQRRAHGKTTPVLLHINREARSVGLKHYELAFGTDEAELEPWRPSPLYLPPVRPPITWFNFELDTLWLTGEVNTNDLETPADWSHSYGLPLLRFIKQEDTSRVQNIACTVSELGWPGDATPHIIARLWSIFRKFPLPRYVPLTVGSADSAKIEDARAQQLTDAWGNYSVESEMDVVWNGWMRGTTVVTSIGDGRQVVLVREEDLAGFLESGGG